MTYRPMSLRALAGAATTSLALGLLLLSPAAAAPAVASGTPRLAAVVPSATALPVLRRGSTGPYVKYLQRILDVSPTGYFGMVTAAAVKKFETAEGFAKPNYTVGPKTWVALKRYALEKASRENDESEIVDPTMTSAARTSKKARLAVPFAAWQDSDHGKAIVKRESGGRCTAKSPSGAYRGKWQMGAPFWKAYGGLAYASTPDKATCLEQDKVAYKGWIASWWGPWGG